MTEQTDWHACRFELVDVLMHEYDSLRDEILQRANGMIQAVSIGCLVLIGVLTFTWDKNGVWPLYCLLAIAAGVFGYTIWLSQRDTGIAAMRLREIEADVNACFGGELLEWETRWGAATNGYWKGFIFREPPPAHDRLLTNLKGSETKSAT